MDNLDVISIFKDIVKLNTTNPDGNEYLVIDYISKIFDKYKIKYDVIEPEKNRSNIIAFIGEKTEKEPIVFISHVDVVEADSEKWKYDPFSPTEENGLIYGRGTLDTKFLTATSLVTFINLNKQSLNRQIIFIAAADEEKGSKYGMPCIVEKYEETLKNGLVINEGGGFYIQNETDPYYTCTVGEKGRCDVLVKLTGTPSASSFPNDNKSTVKFIDVIDRLCNYKFPYESNKVYEKYTSCFNKEISNSFLSKFVEYNGQNKIILSEYNVGDAPNIIPKNIEFKFSIGLLPSKTLEDAKAILEDIFYKMDVQYEITDFLQGFESNCSNEFFEKLQQKTNKYFCKDAKLLPVYALGRTDGRFLGKLGASVYGFSPVTTKIPFEKVIKLVHNVDENIDIDSVLLGVKTYTEICVEMG